MIIYSVFAIDREGVSHFIGSFTDKDISESAFRVWSISHQEKFGFCSQKIIKSSLNEIVF